MTNGILPSPFLAEVSKCVAKARTYILSRQSDEGGFCFYRAEGVDEPGLRDTALISRQPKPVRSGHSGPILKLH